MKWSAPQQWGAKITGVLTERGFLQHDPDRMAEVHVEHAKATKLEDMMTLTTNLQDAGLSYDDVNQTVANAVSQAADVAISRMSNKLAMVGTAIFYFFFFFVADAALPRDHSVPMYQRVPHRLFF